MRTGATSETKAATIIVIVPTQELLGDNGPARLRFGARFEPTGVLVPLVAYAVMRVCPSEARLAE